MSVKYGAPFIWREPEQWVMIFTGREPQRAHHLRLIDFTRWLRLDALA